MGDDARIQLQERMAGVAARAIARIHEKRADLRGMTAQETVRTLQEEYRRARHPMGEGYAKQLVGFGKDRSRIGRGH